VLQSPSGGCGKETNLAPAGNQILALQGYCLSAITKIKVYYISLFLYFFMKEIQNDRKGKTIVLQSRGSMR
jgi:hypothetical protein